MRYVKLFFLGGETQYGRLRPIILFPLILPVYIVYRVCKLFVDFMDRNF